MTLAPDELVALIAQGRAPAILDVRSDAEFAEGHVPGAMHIPFWQLPRRAVEIPGRPTDRLVVYCGHGPRAWYAKAVLRRGGFTRVELLEGHMSQWKRAGRPVVAGL